MKKLKLLASLMVTALVLSLGGKALAQPQGGMNFQNMDPEQMMNMIQERILSSFRDQMDVTNDTEWGLISTRITAVTKARMASMADGGGMMGGRGMMGGPRGGGGAGGGAGGAGGGGFARMFGTPSQESEALQKAIDNNAPAAELRTLLAKLQAAHKEKQAALVKAQTDLRAVLTTRQESIAVLGGLLD